MDDHTHDETLKSLERRRVSAMLTADVDVLDELLHPGLLFGHTDGHADDKEAYLKKFRSGTVRYFDAEQRIVGVQVIGDTALIRAHLRLRAELASGSRQLSVVGLTVWVLCDGSWKMIAHQPTISDI